MSEKLISVIVPVYKVEKYLDKCVESIVNQTYENLEIILVDDGSPDKCPAMCDAWTEKDNRINVIHKENGGLSDARNAGYSISTGEYISFIDSDDWIEEDFYTLLAAELDNGADIAECATRWCNEGDKTILICGFSKPKVLDKVEATQTLLQENGIMQTVWNKLYKRECVDGIFFEKGKFHEDNFWTWQIFLNAKQVNVISNPMYNYVQRNSSIMGEGYSLKRLDAIEGTYNCYMALKNESDYSDIILNKVLTTCMFQLQSVMKYLKGKDKKYAMQKILYYIKSIDAVHNDFVISSVWLKLFVVCPIVTSKVRNVLKIGD